jgi:crotonobetainyl-CoA:carnitine CoA-transferase CaiB-like acyl-CoA transferase
LGLKVLDLTRIIASPTITRELAELGASVLRITSPNVPDMTALLADLGWGKWNAHLDLTCLPDRERLRALILESDVVVDGYRPGVMEKWGFGKEEILKMFEGKKRGVIYVRENCYGWNGPWMGRSGWQQISDAVRVIGVLLLALCLRIDIDLSFLLRTVESPSNLAEQWGMTSQSLQYSPTQIIGKCTISFA